MTAGSRSRLTAGPRGEDTLQLDASLPSDSASVGGLAAQLEDQGYAGLWVGELKHDPFLQAHDAGIATTYARIGTGVAIAFARTPMTVAVTANDLAQALQGRFVLGLGSQVRAHIERRFSMPWSRPTGRMREFIEALRAIWSSWYEDAPLDFQGRYYRHSLMPPAFRPQPHRWGPPPVYLAAVGAEMTELAGEAADGHLFHSFTTPDYFRDVTMSALLRGRARRGADLKGFTRAGTVLVCTGTDEEAMVASIAAARAQIAFYAATPAYRAVLEYHGWGALQTELGALARQQRWSEMSSLVNDEIVSSFAVIGAPEKVHDKVRTRWAGLADRVTVYFPGDTL